MNKRLTFLTFIIATLLAGCASAPTRINGLNFENSGLASDIELNGVLISHGDKFILNKSFQIPTVPHDKNTDRLFGENSVSFTYIPAGPWEFNGSTLFPGFNSSSLRCADSEGCDRYNQLKGPFIHIDCESFYWPESSKTYSQRLHEIEREKTKVDVEFPKPKTAGEAIGVIVAAVGLGVVVVLKLPGAIITAGLNELGVCRKKMVWFDHDEFFDTVKEAVINDYGSIDAYVTDIRQASMAYNTLTNIDRNKRREIEALIQEWKNSINKLLPENDNIDNYHIRYSPYSLVKIPRKEDWSRKRAVIESDLLSHYTEQLASINRQLDSYNKAFKQRYGINITLSTEAK